MMKTEVVYIAYDGRYATTTLDDITDIQSSDGVVLFFSRNKIVMGLAIKMLVYFKPNLI